MVPIAQRTCAFAVEARDAIRVAWYASNYGPIRPAFTFCKEVSKDLVAEEVLAAVSESAKLSHGTARYVAIGAAAIYKIHVSDAHACTLVHHHRLQHGCKIVCLTTRTRE